MEGFFKLNPLHPSGNSILVPYYYSKNWLLKPPYPLEFPLTSHRVGMDIFWNYTTTLFLPVVCFIGIYILTTFCLELANFVKPTD